MSAGNILLPVAMAGELALLLYCLPDKANQLPRQALKRLNEVRLAFLESEL